MVRYGINEQSGMWMNCNYSSLNVVALNKVGLNSKSLFVVACMQGVDGGHCKVETNISWLKDLVESYLWS